MLPVNWPFSRVFEALLHFRLRFRLVLIVILALRILRPSTLILERPKYTDRCRHLLLLRFELPLIVLIEEALVEKGDERIRVDVRRKVKLPMRSVDSPLFLEFCCSLSII